MSMHPPFATVNGLCRALDFHTCAHPPADLAVGAVLHTLGHFATGGPNNKTGVRRQGIAISPDGATALVVGVNNTIGVLNIEKFSLRHVVTKKIGNYTGGGFEQIPCISYSPDGNLVAWGSRDSRFIVADTAVFFGKYMQSHKQR